MSCGFDFGNGAFVWVVAYHLDPLMSGANRMDDKWYDAHLNAFRW